MAYSPLQSRAQDRDLIFVLIFFMRWMLACRMAEDPDTLQKLVLRLQQLCQLEALLDEALAHAPPSFIIPTADGLLTPFADPQTSRVCFPMPWHLGCRGALPTT